MKYTELDVTFKEFIPFADILVAQLNEINFEAYMQDDNSLKAYIQTDLLDKDSLLSIINDVKKETDISFAISAVENQNWNKEWESSFSPVYINEKCVVRADFHSVPSLVKHEIIINPKMSFGTGHHETTALIMNQMFDISFNNKNVIDVGYGTGILSILASKLGALDVLGVDVDQWAFENAHENAQLNKVSNIKFLKGKVEDISNNNFDVLLANINRNVILKDIQKYFNLVQDKADILLSGFLRQDIELILQEIEKFDFQLVCSKHKNKWEMIHLRKG